MRRQYKGRSDAMVRSSDGEQGFWPSYADMMSAVALILFFLMLLSYIQNLITGNNLQSTKDMLADTEATLSLTLKQVSDAEDELQKITLDLDEAKLNLDKQREDLAAQSKLLADQSQLLSDQTAQLADQKSQLADQRAKISEQERYVRQANEELLAMRSQMQTIAVLRLSILEQIRDSMVKVMGDASKVSIGENGNIVLSEGILFDVGKSDIKAEAAPALDQLITVFEKFLSDPENIKYVDSIVISGHTDSTGSDSDNRVLSTDRANAVLNYLMSRGGTRLSQYGEYFCASGYGETRPVADNDTEEGRAANRRIEISIILKDDTVMDIVDNYLNIDLPQADTP
ncbi:MAG: OmpA family protein [Oscillospiraceae bacterium]|nr:OmpA family protein [Oscillospiraceae bacterium]